METTIEKIEDKIIETTKVEITTEQLLARRNRRIVDVQLAASNLQIAQDALAKAESDCDIAGVEY